MPEVLSRFTELVAADRFHPLAMTHPHALTAGSHKVGHQDPFDRMLAAQCEHESLVLVTRDSAFRAFRTRTLW